MKKQIIFAESVESHKNVSLLTK
ncbi:uncharacterized protein METZ01_LOCUS41087 [marine metagenome]|uniref:Uncharacterized protein n=1 Tax=marine metagenome TaxID=408172 RepID=A0A381RGB4_9ZZZZ